MEQLKLTLSKRKAFILICTVFTAVVNSVFVFNTNISYLLLLCQILILSYFFLKKKYIDYLGMYILFCGLSMEYERLIGDNAFYGFKDTRILGINLGILTLIPLLTISVRYFFMAQGKRFSKFYNFFMFLQASATVMGILLLLFNDNNVLQIFPDITLGFINAFYLMALQQIIIIIIFAMLINTYDNIEPIEDYFLSLLIGVVISLLCSYLTGIRGVYGGVQTLMVSNNVRWLPLLLVLPIYKKYKGNITIWLLGLLGAFLSLLYNATGKMVIMYVLIPLIYAFISVKRKQYKKVGFILLLSPLILVGISIAVQYLAESSILFESKMNQALSLLGFFTGEFGVDEVSGSPRLRIYETANILYEYLDKPWLLLFGKGFMGTVKNYTNITYGPGAYSDFQWSTGLFTRMHESTNKLLLTNGLLGIIFLFTTIKNGFKDISKTPWGAIGLYWLYISYGHSITMTAFGFPCLVYSVIQADKCDEENDLLRLKAELKADFDENISL